MKINSAFAVIFIITVILKTSNCVNLRNEPSLKPSPVISNSSIGNSSLFTNISSSKIHSQLENRFLTSKSRNLPSIDTKEFEKLEKEIKNTSQVVNNSNESNMTFAIFRTEGNATLPYVNITSNALLSALEFIKENNIQMNKTDDPTFKSSSTNSTLNITVPVPEKSLVQNDSAIIRELPEGGKVLELASKFATNNDSLTNESISIASNITVANSSLNFSSDESKNSSVKLNTLLKRKIGKRKSKSNKKVVFNEAELNRSLTKAIKKMREHDENTEFNLVINNTKLEAFAKILESYNLDTNKLGKLTKWLYKKVKSVVKTFKEIKKHYGKNLKDEVQKQTVTYLSEEDLVSKQLIVSSEHLESLKEKISNFYKDSLENVSESNENYNDLIKIKEKLLEIVKRIENLSKINILQQEILRKAKDVISDIELNLIRENLNGVIEMEENSTNSNGNATLPKIEKELQKINSHL